MTALLDASTLVRYLTNDPPAMARISAEVIEGDEALRITDVVLAETAYVLSTFYEMPRAVIVDELIGLLRRANLETVNVDTDLACDALLMCRESGRTSFADALLWAEARSERLPPPHHGPAVSRRQHHRATALGSGAAIEEHRPPERRRLSGCRCSHSIRCYSRRSRRGRTSR